MFKPLVTLSRTTCITILEQHHPDASVEVVMMHAVLAALPRGQPA